MWMMGCSDGGGGFNMSDSFNAPKKVRPILPKHPSSTTTCNGNVGVTTHPPPRINCFHGTDLFLLNQYHHFATGEQCRKDFNTAATVVSSRWNPTPEQLNTLEELYRCGTRTPSAEQIQHITSQLRRYGKIEGKNVFYWFQNHKARERQKRRRQTQEQLQRRPHLLDNNNNLLETKESDIEVEGKEAKNWGLSTNTNLTSTLNEEGGGGGGARTQESKTDGCIQLEAERRIGFDETHATWQNMHLSYSPDPITTFTATTSSSTTTPITAETPNLSIYFNGDQFLVTNQKEECGAESHTLQLFPLQKEENGSRNTSANNRESDQRMPHGTCYQFYEFL